MEPGFWQDKWNNNEIGFHLDQVHPLLVRYWTTPPFLSARRIFVPLCGKTLDMHFLRGQGAEVIGAELSGKAVTAFFAEAGVEPEVSEWSGGKCYRHDGITLFQGDIFSLTQDQLGPVDAIYDRAAVIALPDSLRQQYVRHLLTLSARAPQLLITLSYDQSQMPGPPFSVDAGNVQALYGDDYVITELAGADILDHEPGFRERGLTALAQHCWQLTPR